MKECARCEGQSRGCQHKKRTRYPQSYHALRNENYYLSLPTISMQMPVLIAKIFDVTTSFLPRPVLTILAKKWTHPWLMYQNMVLPLNRYRTKKKFPCGDSSHQYPGTQRARDLSSSANPLVRYCHFGVSPVNYSDSDSRPLSSHGYLKFNPITSKRL